MTDTTPAVSVVTPCYKVTEYVAGALDSLRAQTFRNFETILVNDGCPDTDNLERVLAPYRREIIYFKQEHGGLSVARNTAIRAARAPIIALLDPDDAWERGYLEAQTALLGGPKLKSWLKGDKHRISNVFGYSGNECESADPPTGQRAE
jgi:glycosyltransferase involved in cell wall biosynthesis